MGSLRRGFGDGVRFGLVRADRVAVDWQTRGLASLLGASSAGSASATGRLARLHEVLGSRLS